MIVEKSPVTSFPAVVKEMFEVDVVIGAVVEENAAVGVVVFANTVAFVTGGKLVTGDELLVGVTLVKGDVLVVVVLVLGVEGKVGNVPPK